MQIKGYVILIFLLFCLACSNKNPAPIEELENQYPPEFVFKSIKIPESLRQNQDSLAQVVVGYVNMYNEMEKYVPLLNPSPDSGLSEYTSTEYGPPWVESWKTNEGFLVLLLVSGNETKYDWEVKFWGKDSINDIYYNKWILLTASNLLGDENGGIELYEPNSKNIDVQYFWISYPDLYNIVRIYRIINFVDNNHELSIDMNFHEDLSGELSITKMGEERFYVELKISWNSLGKGEWWRYNEIGEVIEAGSWD